MKKHTEKALDYFNRHQNNECFITSDGRVFHNSGSARSFATTLENDEVEHYTRKEVEQINAQGIDELSQGHSTDDKEAELLALELIPKNYQKMLSLVKHFGLTPEGNKAENLIAVLTEYKSKLEK